MEQPYKKLIVFQESDLFLKNIYNVSASFPKEEMYNLTSQIRRAALSVVLNIVEGQARGTKTDMRRFFIMSRGSLAECAYILEFAKDRKYLSFEAYKELESQRRKSGFLLQRLIESIS